MAKLIKSNGEVTEVKPANGKFTLDELYKLTNCNCIEKYRAGTKVFIMDENGLPKGLPTNSKAKHALYMACNGEIDVQEIVGDVLICETSESN